MAKGLKISVLTLLIAFSLLLVQVNIFGVNSKNTVFTASAPTPPTTPIVSGDWITYAAIASNESTYASRILAADGTELDPYILTSEEDLAWLAYRVNNGISFADNYFSGEYFRIESLNALDLSGYSWTPIGNTTSDYFGGHFDGNNAIINGLTIINGTASEGFFGNIQGGTVSNIKFTNAYVSSTSGINDGIVAGNVIPEAGRTDIIFSNIEVDENSFITSSVARVGGLSGSFGGNKMINCVNNATVVGSTGLVAGISANIETPDGIAATEFKDCLNTGTVYSATGNQVGGLFAQIDELTDVSATITFTNCRNEGDVTGKTGTTGIMSSKSTNAAGGIVAYALREVIFENCSNTGEIESDYQPGGILGLSTETRNQVMTNCYNTGNIIVWGTNAGGLIGETYTVDMTNCYNTGNIILNPSSTMTGHCRMGGLAGEMKGNIINCYNTGDIYSTRAVVGGLIGSAYSRDTTTSNTEVLYIENCYNTGDVTGNGINVAGLVGYVGYLRGLVVKDSYNSGDLTNNSTSTDNFIGGLIGEVDSNATSAYVRYVQMDRCYNTGSITASRINVGGLFGRLAINKDESLDSWIRDSYNLGDMVNDTATSAGNVANMGGIVGILQFFAGSDAKSFEISNVYNTGTISAQNVTTPPSSWGGLLGAINVNSATNKEITIENSYSVVQTGINGVGSISGAGGSGTIISGTSNSDILKTEQDLIDELTSSLDSEIWGIDPNINGGLPYLKSNQEELVVTGSTSIMYAGFDIDLDNLLVVTGGSTAEALTYAIVSGESTGTGTISGSNLTVTSAGTFLITVTMPGDALYKKIELDVLVTVTKGTQTVIATDKDANYTTTPIDLDTLFGLSGVSYEITDGDVVGTISGSSLTLGTTGTATITITKAENGLYDVATTTVTLTIEKGDQAALLINNDTKTYAGSVFDITDLFAVTGGTTNGIVTYTVTPLLGEGTFDGTDLTVTKAGTFTITATMAGNSLYNEVVATATFTVNQGNQVALFIDNETKTYADATFDLATLFATTGGTTNGEVTYEVTNETGAGTLFGNILTVTKTGAFTITATMAGNGLYNEVIATATFTVNQGTQTINASDETLTYDGIINLNTVFGLTGVTYSITGGDIIGIITDAALTPSIAGTATITITKAETDLYAVATKIVTLTLDKADQEALSISNDTKTYIGGTFDIEALFNATGGTTNGAVTYEVTNEEGAGTLFGNILTVTKAGTFTITATMAGSGLYNEVIATATFTVNKGTQDALIINSADSIVYGAGDYTLSFTGGTTGETVTYSIDGNIAGNTIEITRAGIIKIVATMPGNDLYDEVESVVFELLVQKATPGEVVTPTTSDSNVFGSKLSNWNLSDLAWAWLNENAVPTVGSSHIAYKTVDDVNYDYTGVQGYDEASHSIRISVSVDVTKSQNVPLLTVPTVLEIKNAGTVLGEWELPQGWYWEDSNTVTENGEQLYNVYYRVDDVNYDYTGVEGYDATRSVVVYQVKITTTVADPDKDSLFYIIIACAVAGVILLGVLIIIMAKKGKKKKAVKTN